ncbi:hypothetical protein CIHG_01215 [Coccidioides immitis H538.4]|uniref:Riboflavin kinase n=1 Tax=Coccidioides immitis H538.4 TaxID=396776 RepID=A0A0J8U8N6_COCIT|nr:hypothetical protein CIHG_01215 [Coccidioides immitis H538.4]
MRPDTPRDPLAGPDSGPESPYPIRLSGPVIKGFGRGSKELGIPTANIPADGLSEHPDLESGVYYGVAALEPSRFQPTDAEIQKDQPSNETTILPCVLSNRIQPLLQEHRSLRDPTSSPGDNSASKPPHTRHHFHHFPDFYGTPLNLLILGYIRPEYDYVSLEALVEDIRVDCEVAKRSLARRKYICFIQEGGDVDDEGTKEARKWLRTF